jgi:hypothetical protein
MSVALTEQAVRERRKTVTRRLGWKFLKPGDRLVLCPKTRGVSKADRVELAEVEVVSMRREPLDAITDGDVFKEGVPILATREVGGAARAFVRFFCEHMKCEPSAEVTRIEWRYLD